jgi:hypothetical protein
MEEGAGEEDVGGDAEDAEGEEGAGALCPLWDTA